MRSLQACCIAVALICVSGQSFGVNGLNLIGFGVESNLLAGADVATARDTGALNTNPAGLTQIDASALDLHFGLGFPAMRHTDRLGNDAEAANKPIPVANFGFAHRLSNQPVTLGVGTFAQGGAGNRYKSLNTPFGTRDELSSKFAIAKLVPGFAYQASEQLSLGAALPIVVADLRQKIFPGTSAVNPANPAQPFFGSTLNETRGASAGVRLGLQYRPSNALTLGLTYANKTKLKLANGRLRVNGNAVGLGEVTYRDAEVKGLALPQEIGLGLAWQPSDAWLLSVKLAWLDWSDALKSSTVIASRPDQPAAPPSVSTRVTLDWRDQYVFAVGAAYRLSERTQLMAGYNHGKNPIPTRTLSPLLDAFAEDHVTFGAIHRLGAHWQLGAGIEYDFKRTLGSDNPEFFFGPGARDRGELFALHLGLSRRW